MKSDSTTVRNVLRNLDRRHLVAIIVAVLLSSIAIAYIGNMLYRATRSELELRGEIDVIRSAGRFDDYLVTDKNALLTAASGVNQMLLAQASTETILGYLVVQSTRIAEAVAESFTGLYGWIRMEYLDGAGWVPGEDFVATERPWYKAAMESPEEIVFVDPYVDENTGDVMITIATLLDDGESVVALDIGLEGVQEITEEIAADTPGSTVMVLDNSSTAIAHSDISQVGTQYRTDGEDIVSLVVRGIAREGEGHFTISAEGREYMVYAKQIEGGWYCVSVIDTGIFYRPLLGVIVFTVVLGLLAAALVLVIFYSLSLREMNNRNLHVQVRAAADIYDALVDVNLTADTCYELNNHRITEHTGLLHSGAQTLLYRGVDEVVREDMRPFMREFLDLTTLNKRLRTRNTLTVEYQDVGDKWCRGRFICAQRDRGGIVTRVLWGTETIDDEKRQQERLRYMAETDLMTGVYNRVSGQHRVIELLDEGRGGMFVLFDIDFFKHFNDLYGHKMGDEVIIAVAGCLKNAFRGDDILMRLGGDEFGAFAPGVFTQEIAGRILDRFYDNLGNIRLEGLDEAVCVSAGVVFGRDRGVEGFQALYEAADRCMYESKRISGSHITYKKDE